MDLSNFKNKWNIHITNIPTAPGKYKLSGLDCYLLIPVYALHTNYFLDIFLFLQYPYISSIGKFVVFNGILLHLTNIYEKSTIGYININSTIKSLPLDFKPIDIDLPQEVVSTSNRFLHSQNCSSALEENVFVDDYYDFRLHVFSGYRKY